ncbi:MAG TPA: alpha/beta fold hydrolase [Stellaceae bacterium]|nr:alpha/beta fold hydrolase [Stellaceae bacterium]
MLIALVAIPLIAVLALVGMIAFGTAAAPPPMASVYDNVRRMDMSELPPLQRYTARDGASLAYRAWPGGGERVAILIHGSTSSSRAMNPLAKALNAAGATVYAPDMRGHGESGRRGDIDYIGQLDEDLADLVAMLKPKHPGASFTLIGFSSGGGFTLRMAGGRYGDLFDRYILLAPYLGYDAPSSRHGGGWAAPYVPRVIGLVVLNRIGIHGLEGLPIVAFARRPDPSEPVPTYSFRLAFSFSAHRDFRDDFRHVRQPMALLVGGDDDEMFADAYAPLLQPMRSDIPVQVIPGVGHIGVTSEPAALAAIRAVFREEPAAGARTDR